MEFASSTEVVLRHGYNLDRDLVHHCPTPVLAKIMQCVVCELESTPVFYGSCEKRGHVICQPCYTAYLNEMEGNLNWVVCPVTNQKSKICGQKFIPWSFEQGVSPYWQFFLRHCEFQCSSSIYGCSFKGPGWETIEHETSGCTFSDFRRCKLEKWNAKNEFCEAQFHSGIELLNHYIQEHEFPNVGIPLLRIDVPLKNEMKKAIYRRGGLSYSSSETEKGKRILMKICAYADEKYCFLIVEEHEHWLRLWATQADSSVEVEDIVPVKISVPAYAAGMDEKTGCQYQFIGKLSPFNTFHYKDDDVGYFDVPKHVLEPFLRQLEDGKKQVSVEFQIGDISTKLKAAS